MRQIFTFTAVLLLLCLSCARIGQPDATTPTVAPTALPLPTPVTTVAPTPTSPPQMAAYTAEFIAIPCQFFIPAGVTVECGFARVPENRYGDPADTIDLMVAVYRSHSPTPAADPVLFLQGGPGSEAVSWAAGFYRQVVEPILAERDFVVYDQRGTGLSRPSLDCPEIRDVYLADRQADWAAEERLDTYSDAFLACRRRLIAGGASLAAYTTESSAADVRDVALALGYEQVNLYGVSYGTRLAQVVMRDYPEMVRSAVLDSVVPLEANLYNEVLVRADSGLDTLFSGCAADPFAVPYTGAEEPPVLEPFSSELYGLSGLGPAGWREIGQGFYNREGFLSDPTQIGMQAAGGVPTEDWLLFLQGNFQGRGFAEAPAAASERAANGLLWRLYTAEYQGNLLDIALAESDSGVTLLVVMLSRPGEREALYEGLFLPVIDGLQLADG